MMVDALKTYYEVSQDKRASKFQSASQIPASNLGSLKNLWNQHQNILEHLKNGNIAPEKGLDFSFLDLKIKIAGILLTECVFCPRRCRVDRKIEPGVCGVTKPRVASEFIHLGEEAPLIPSHTIFFAGCNLKCVYCQNSDISQNPQLGIDFSPSILASRIDQRRREGSRNVNFVGGDPAPNLHYILKTMNFTAFNIPVVWNSNMYLSRESMLLLEGFVDLFLTDFKYGNDECAINLSGISDYMEVVGTNHKWAREVGDMIIRHLVLPGHLECCSLPLMQWIYENLGEDVVINIMGQYQPQYQSFHHDMLSRPTSPLEVEQVVAYAKDLGFINIIN
jgi:putative pyruvate formate lyase activating enzyme